MLADPLPLPIPIPIEGDAFIATPAPAPLPAVIAPVASSTAPVAEVDPITKTYIPTHMLSQIAAADFLDLTLGNYVLWARRVRDTLSLCGDLEEYLDPASVCPDSVARPVSARAWNTNNHHVLSFVRVNCSSDEREHIEHFTSASALWAFLKDRHSNRGPHAQVLLLRDLLQLSFNSSKAIVPQAHQCLTICRQIITMGPLNLDSLAKVALLHMMRDSLPELQRTFADSLSRATVASPYTVTDMIKRLEMEQSFRNADKPTVGLTTDLAMSAQPHRNGARIPKQCSHCKRTGHVTADCFQPGGAMADRRDEILARIAARKAARMGSSAPAPGATAQKVYDNTGKAYFLSAAAPVPARAPEAAHSAASIVELPDGAPDQLPVDDAPLEWLAALDACGDSQYEAYLATADAFSVSANWDTAYSAGPDAAVEPFLFDSGASTHLSPVRGDFFELVPIAPRGIRGVNGSVIYATGIGKIRLSLGRGKHLILDHALHVPAASVRLISVRALCDGPHGYIVGFDSKGVTLRHRSGAAFFTGTRVGRGLYALSGSPPAVDSALAVSLAPTLETWHRRLGHANFRATHSVASKVRAAGTPVNLSILPAKCDHCIMGKQTRSSVPKVREGVRSTERGGTFFIDATGDQCTRSASGNICSLDIIDDFSSYGWAFPIASKGDCSAKLRTFLIARRAEGCPIRRIVTDNGECATKEITDVCAELGIEFIWTAAYTSAHNGKVERIHRTYLGKSLAMRLAAKIPENRWDELYLTACYLTNRTPSASLPSGVTPYETWFGSPPSLRHLREIGCRAYPLINTHNPKLRARSFECILIGYGLNSKTYRVYHPPTRRVLSSFHVSFIESHESSAPTSPSPSSSSIPTSDISPSCELPSASAPPPIPSSPPHDLPNDVLTPWPTDPTFVPSVPHTAPHPPPSLLASLPSAPAPDTSSIPHVTVSPVADPLPSLSPAAPRSSSRVRQPSERRAAADGLPWVSALERAVSDCRESSARAVAERAARHDARVDSDIAHYTDLDLALAATLQLDSVYDGDPTSLKDALASPFAAQWRSALEEEFSSIKSLGVYNLIPRGDVPGNRRIMHGKPVFRLKMDENGAPVRFKVRWVCKGYEAVWGQDYYSTTSPTMRLESFRVLLHLAASLDWDIHQVDVKTAFLYGTLPDNEICYMEQPRGFEAPGKEDWVWELRKGLYGMPQGGRTWNRTMHDHLTSVGFARVPSEYCLYHRTTSEGTVITGVHVDDFIAIASSPAAGALFKADLRREWTISDLGEARFCIGIAIERDRAARTVRISQTALIDRVIAQFGMSDAHPAITPMETDCNLSRSKDSPVSDDDKAAARSWPYRALVGSLNYIAVGSRPDISFAVQQLSQFLDCYGRNHWEAAKRVVRYLKGTRTLSLHLGGPRTAFLLGYTDSNHARCLDSRKSVGGYCYSLGTGMVSWAAPKQGSPADSTTEAEYVAASEASKEAVWLRSVLASIGHPQDRPTPLAVDNSGAINLSADPSHHSRTKHIDIKYHILRDHVASDKLFVYWLPTDDNVADILTKPLPGPKFTLFRGCLGLR